MDELKIRMTKLWNIEFSDLQNVNQITPSFSSTFLRTSRKYTKDCELRLEKEIQDCPIRKKEGKKKDRSV